MFIITQHSQRVYGEIWQNGAFIECLVYQAAQPDCDGNDRIHLLITDATGDRRGWLMNVEDAQAIIKCLERGIEKSNEYGVPHGPMDK